jgi:hypothetical protein
MLHSTPMGERGQADRVLARLRQSHTAGWQHASETCCEPALLGFPLLPGPS